MIPNLSRWATITIILSMTILQVSSLQVLAAPQPLTADFRWLPRFVIVGERITFTATVSGATSPVHSWDFGDGQMGSGNPVLHTYTQSGNFTVALTVTEGTENTTVTKTITIQPWPIRRHGWTIYWNITDTDGINIWNVTYRETLVIRDARLPGIIVRYRYNICLFYDEFLSSFLRRDREELSWPEGRLFYENSPNASDPWFQLRAAYDVPGYFYQQVWRFYPDGRWDARLINGHGGCGQSHIYEPRWRIDLAIIDDKDDMMSQYSPNGRWRNLIWERDYIDNRARDPSHNGAAWRFGDNGKYYYIVSTINRVHADLPEMPSKIVLVRTKPAEIERTHSPASEDPSSQFAAGELAFRRNMSFWFIAPYWDHGPLVGGPISSVILSFYPYGI